MFKMGQQGKGERFVSNPDLEEVSRLMSATWQRPCWEYTSDILRCYINRPSGDVSLSLGLYYDDELAGYLCYVPYQILYRGNQYPAVYGTWWTASQAFRGQSVAMKLQKELLGRAREKGVAGLFTVTHHGTLADRANKAVFGLLHESFQLKNTFRQMMAVPRMIRRRIQGSQSPHTCLYHADYREQCLELLDSNSRQLDVCFMAVAEDIDFLLKDRPLAQTWIWADSGRVLGLINVVRKRYFDQRDTVNAYVEHMAFSGMTSSQIREFLFTVFMDAYWDSIDAVCIPDTGYFDRDLFSSIGFRRSQRQFSLYHIPLDKRLEIEELSSFYVNVF